MKEILKKELTYRISFKTEKQDNFFNFDKSLPDGLPKLPNYGASSGTAVPNVRLD